jgi:hypothetical protein
MVFYDLTDRDLVYGQRGSSGWTYTAVDTTGDVGGGAAIAADSAGGLHVVYQDWTNKRDKYVHRTAGGAWQAAEVFDGTHSGGSGRDIVTDAAGRPHICYQDAAQKDLRYAHWTGSSWAIQVVAATGAGCAIALDSAGAPHIVYRDTSNGTVVYAH